jgi:hypothetical protein
MLEELGTAGAVAVVGTTAGSPSSFTMSADPDADDPDGMNAWFTRTKEY